MRRQDYKRLDPLLLIEQKKRSVSLGKARFTNTGISNAETTVTA